jgi:hypothetical protein
MAGGHSTSLGKPAHPDGTGGYAASSQLSIIEQHKAEAGSLAFHINKFILKVRVFIYVC